MLPVYNCTDRDFPLAISDWERNISPDVVPNIHVWDSAIASALAFKTPLTMDPKRTVQSLALRWWFRFHANLRQSQPLVYLDSIKRLKLLTSESSRPIVWSSRTPGMISSSTKKAFLVWSWIATHWTWGTCTFTSHDIFWLLNADFQHISIHSNNSGSPKQWLLVPFYLPWLLGVEE